MKLATYIAGTGTPAIGSIDGDNLSILDLRAAHRLLSGSDNPALASMLALIEGGEAALDVARRLAEQGNGDARLVRKLEQVRLLSPLPEPPQLRDFSCYGQHMRDASASMARLKARLAGKPVPDRDSFPKEAAEIYRAQPIYYLSNRFNVVGHDADISWPSYCNYLDYELELAIVIGPGGKDITRSRAREHVFGFTIFNDFSARDRQAREMEGFMGPAKGKSFDTGNAIGPWIITRDEIADPLALDVAVRVNGEIWAKSNTGGILHSFADMIAFVSQDETLHAGEIFGSGTVGGCSGLEIERWLKDGDVVELEIAGIGCLRNRVRRRSS